MKVKVFTPTHSHPTPHYAVSIAYCLVDLSHRYDFSFDAPTQVSNLAEARCIAIEKAIHEGADKLLFVDDDICFKPDDAKRIIEADGDVVGAVYRKKLKEDIVVGYRLQDVGRQPEVKIQLVGMAAVGMGFTCVDVDFVRRTQFDVQCFVPKYTGRVTRSLFEFRTDLDLSGERRFLGEDEVFCKHVIEAGGKVWLHTGVRVGHVGLWVYE